MALFSNRYQFLYPIYLLTRTSVLSLVEQPFAMAKAQAWMRTLYSVYAIS